MSDQLDLFAPTAPGFRIGDMDAARDAAKQAKVTDRLLVLRALYNAGDRGLTDHEAAERCGIEAGNGSAGKRRGELEQMGFVAGKVVGVKPDGSPLFERRVTRAPSTATVWVITAAGRGWLLEHPGVAA